jgi:hypothetical protein
MRIIAAAGSGGAALILFAVAGGFLVAHGRASGTAQRLRDRGVTVRAKVTAVTANTDAREYSRCPWVIEASWRDESAKVTRYFKSENIWGDPRAHYPPGSEVVVVFLPEAPGTCAFRLDRLPATG